MDGQPEFHAKGTYYLRFVRNGKRIWQAVGADADAALAAFRRTEHWLRSVALGLTSPDGEPTQGIEPSEGVLFGGAVETYVDRLSKLGRAPKTISEARRILKQFGDRLPGRIISSVSGEDLIEHMEFLRQEGLSERTISNHIVRILALLRKHKIIDLLGPEEMPAYDEPEVLAYNLDQLKALFSAASEEQKLTFNSSSAPDFVSKRSLCVLGLTLTSNRR